MCNIDAAVGLLTVDGTWNAQSIEGTRRNIVAQPVVDITEYLKEFTGKDFDPLFAQENAANPDLFTQTSLSAIRNLSVDTTPRFQQWLLSIDGQKRTGALLAEIPNTDLGTLSRDEFRKLMNSNRRSPTSKLWHLLREKLIEFDQPMRAGRQVTASKLIHGKRPNLVPITDTFVREELRMSWSTSWTCSYEIMKDPRIAPLCSIVRSAVAVNGPFPAGVNPTTLSDVRILDLATWCFHRRRRKR